jgi:hypothetical protein
MYGLSKEEWQDLVLSVNVRKQNRRLTPYEVAKLICKALNRVDAPTLASDLNFKDLRTFDKIKAIAKAPEEFGDLIDWGSRRGSLSMSTAYELLRVPALNTNDQKSLFKACIEAELTKDEARQIVQIHARSGGTPTAALDSVLKSRPKIQRSHLILGSLLSEKAKNNATQSLKSHGMRKLHAALARSFPAITAQVFRVTSNGFSLLLSDSDHEKLRELVRPATVEQAITKLVENLT